jgi:hypothetical protein
MTKSCGSLIATIALAIVLSMGGCSSNSVQSQVAAMNTSNIKRVANLFAAYQNIQGGEGPKDAQTIIAFAKSIPVDALHNMKIDENNLNALFISERDNKPFRIKFGTVRGAMSPHIPVIFEEQGVGDTRQVAWTNARVEELGAAEYQRLWSEKEVPISAGPPHGEKPPESSSK